MPLSHKKDAARKRLERAKAILDIQPKSNLVRVQPTRLHNGHSANQQTQPEIDGSGELVPGYY